MKKIEKTHIISGGGCNFFGGIKCGGALIMTGVGSMTFVGAVAGAVAFATCGELWSDCKNSQ